MRAGTCLFLVLLCGGCALGPRALEKTHGRYLDAVSRVEEEQLLRNIVRVRYDEAPLVLNINSVTTQYEFSTGAEARPFFSTEATTANIFRSFSRVLPFAEASTSARPTFVLDPADDGNATRQFLTPISADALTVLFRNEARLDTVLRLWVERINGRVGGEARRAAELLQALKEKGAVSIQPGKQEEMVGGPVPASAMTARAAVEAVRAGLQYRPTSDGKSWALFRKTNGLAIQVTPGSESLPELAELRTLLGLRPDLTRYRLRVIEAALPEPAALAAGDTIHMTARSTSRVYRFLAGAVEVPQAHLACGIVRPTMDHEGEAEGVFAVHTATGHRPPANAFVAVPYRGLWYYIDASDTDSKATLALVLQLGRLDFKGQRISAGPALTLPVGR
jgi:hypothetical protein